MRSDVDLIACEEVYEWRNGVLRTKVEHQPERYGYGESGQSLLKHGQQNQSEEQALKNTNKIIYIIMCQLYLVKINEILLVILVRVAQIINKLLTEGNCS